MSIETPSSTVQPSQWYRGSTFLTALTSFSFSCTVNDLADVNHVLLLLCAHNILFSHQLFYYSCLVGIVGAYLKAWVELIKSTLINDS